MRATAPSLVGYFSRQIDPAPKPAVPTHLVEICCAGHCNASDPKGWLDLWLHNEFWLCDTERLAWAVATQTENLRRLCAELRNHWDGRPGSVELAVDRFIARHIPPPGACSSWDDADPRWQLFAFRLYPTLFVAGKPEPIRFPQLRVGPLPPAYERIGYDAVSVGAPRPEEAGLAGAFAHSSLSPFCNGRCHDIPVNRFCLLDTAEEGLRQAQEFSAGGGEPEPYVAVEVWRRSGMAEPPSRS